MSRPTFYPNDRLRLGTLSGSEDDTFNPKERLADGSITLPYVATVGVTPAGAFGVTLPSGESPDYFIVGRANALSGTSFQVFAEDIGGGNSTLRASGDAPDTGETFILALSGTPPRRVWRIEVSGANGADQLQVFEAGLTDQIQLERPQVGVSRQQVRRFSRIDIRGSQPFVRREGPLLRQNQYPMLLISGAQIDAYRELQASVDGGQFLLHTDDLGNSYWAELPVADPVEADEAGISAVTVVAREVRSD